VSNEQSVVGRGVVSLVVGIQGFLMLIPMVRRLVVERSVWGKRCLARRLDWTRSIHVGFVTWRK